MTACRSRGWPQAPCGSAGRSLLAVGVAAFSLLIATDLGNATIPGQASSPIHRQTIVLYDGARGGTPDTQGMVYSALPIPSQATQTYSGGVTTLDTNVRQLDQAGYSVTPTLALTLSRATGFTLTFTTQVVTETHSGTDRNGDGIDDRAGLSVILLGEDRQGIELGFWPGEIWAQDDGAAEPPGGTLFTHAEGVTFDTTAGLVTYDLSVSTGTYTLSVGGVTILGGDVRDYTAFSGVINPYQTPNFVFLGDDSTSAKGTIRLSFVALSVTGYKIFLPLIAR